MSDLVPDHRGKWNTTLNNRLSVPGRLSTDSPAPCQPTALPATALSPPRLPSALPATLEPIGYAQQKSITEKTTELCTHLHEYHPLAARVLPALGRAAAVHEGMHVAVSVRLRQDREGVIGVLRKSCSGVLVLERGSGGVRPGDDMLRAGRRCARLKVLGWGCNMVGSGRSGRSIYSTRGWADSILTHARRFRQERSRFVPDTDHPEVTRTFAYRDRYEVLVTRIISKPSRSDSKG